MTVPTARRAARVLLLDSRDRVLLAAMELFGQEVIPHFDKDPMHSTTRYREAYEATI